MLKQSFENKLELIAYIEEQKIRKIKGYLTCSERDQLERIIKEPNSYIKEEKESPKGKSIITDIKQLRKPCEEVKPGEDVKEIIKDLKDTLARNGGLGISANQIGYNKRISYVKIPKFVNKEKKIEYNEYVLINAKITEKERVVKVNNEECLSFSGIGVITKRYVFITVEYLNEKLEIATGILQDLEALAVQHEVDHQNGITIFQRKWVSK